MITIRHILVVTIALGITACGKKKYPESFTENEPVFYFAGTVDGLPLKISAGIDNYYMYSSFSADADKVNAFTGQLKQAGCTDCRNMLELKINDYKPSQPGFINNIDSALSVKAYKLNDLNSGQGYEVSFKGNFTNQSSPVFKWNFGDGSTSNEMNPTHYYKKAGRYRVCLTITGANGCTGSVCNDYVVGDETCIASVRSSYLNDTSLKFSANVIGQAPFRYLWEFGDGGRSTDAAPSHVYRYKGGYPIRLRLIDANEDTAAVNYNVVTKGDQSSCATNIEVLSIKKVGSDVLSEVSVAWTDAAGKKYTSKGLVQPGSSFFRINNISDYEVNENGLKTKKINFSLSCVLSDGTRQLTVENAGGVICVAYP